MEKVIRKVKNSGLKSMFLGLGMLTIGILILTLPVIGDAGWEGTDELLELTVIPNWTSFTILLVMGLVIWFMSVNNGIRWIVYTSGLAFILGIIGFILPVAINLNNVVSVSNTANALIITSGTMLITLSVAQIIIGTLEMFNIEIDDSLNKESKKNNNQVKHSGKNINDKKYIEESIKDYDPRSGF